MLRSPSLVLALCLPLPAAGTLLAQDLPEPPLADEDGEEDEGDDDAGGGDAGDGDGAEGKDPKEKKRAIDKDSPTALALAEILHVDPNFGKDDRRVELTYDFLEPVQMEDFSVVGFDRVEPGSGLEITAGSQRAGLMLHTLNMKGEYEVEVTCKVEWMAPSTQVVFVFGDGKAGGMWGNAWCKGSSRGFKPVSSRVARTVDLSREKFNAAREVKLRYEVGSGEVRCWVNGVKAGGTDKLKRKLEGRVGIYLTNGRLRVTTLVIKGEIDGSKL